MAANLACGCEDVAAIDDPIHAREDGKALNHMNLVRKTDASQPRMAAKRPQLNAFQPIGPICVSTPVKPWPRAVAGHTPQPEHTLLTVGSSALLGGMPNVTLFPMTIKARVRAGRLVVDESTDLPEGTEIELLPLDPGDWLDETDRQALHAALRESDADVAAGRFVDAAEILKELRSR